MTRLSGLGSTKSLMLSDYQKEQLDALVMVRAGLERMNADSLSALRGMIADYRNFRNETDRFLEEYFSETCTWNCYQNQLSACCSKDGIITFFADVVINVLHCDSGLLNRLEAKLRALHTGFKCVYLTPEGCLWRIKPIVCQMFLCDQAKEKVFAAYPAAGREWEALRMKKNNYTWPDRPVVFDALEQLFIKAGYISPLMYLNYSPGLLMVKRRAGLESFP